MDDHYVESAAFRVRATDTVGAGDAFSAAFVHGFSANWDPAQIADFAKPGKRDLLTRNVVGWRPNVLKRTLISKIL